MEISTSSLTRSDLNWLTTRGGEMIIIMKNYLQSFQHLLQYIKCDIQVEENGGGKENPSGERDFHVSLKFK